jgi:hypothetical protein
MIYIKKYLKEKREIFNSDYQNHNFDIKKLNKYMKKNEEEQSILDVSCYNGESYPLDRSLKGKFDLELEQFMKK